MPRLKPGLCALLLLTLILLVGCSGEPSLPTIATAVAAATQGTLPDTAATAATATLPVAPTSTATSAPLATDTPIAPTATATPDANAAPPTYGYKVAQTYPHDPAAFTEGLLLDGTTLYESTGLNGQSDVREVDFATGVVRQKTALAPAQFGEGLALIGDRLAQLTWQNQIGNIYNRADLRQVSTFSYTGEGWGLTYDGTRLIMSDGTANIRFLDPTTFAELGRVQVHDNSGPITQINELEAVRGALYANIWLTDRIAQIDPASGRVVAWLNLAGIDNGERPANTDAVLNGIAFDPAQNRLLVTGKLWPHLYAIDILDSAGQVHQPGP